MKKTMKWLFPFLAVALLAPGMVAFATDAGDDFNGQDAIQITAADPSELPNWQVFGKAVGGVDTPGNLFYIDATENASDITATLYITNTKELSHCYRYLILEVGVYVESGEGKWQKASTCDTFITLKNGQVSFTLQGSANYKVTIDSGSFRCTSTNVDGGSFSPQFFMEAE